jgi:transcriptional regulator with XRE-family HTH domain
VARVSFGEAIKQRREELGITQAELAKRLGVHKQTVVKYEADAITMPTDRLSDLAAALDITLGGFVARIDDERITARIPSVFSDEERREIHEQGP